MINIPPLVRVALGLVLVTASLLVAADMLFGLTPDYTRPVLDARKKLVETLALQYSELASRGDLGRIGEMMDAVVDRNGDVLSAGLRRADGVLLGQTNGHEQHWRDAPAEGSTPTHARVPIMAGEVPWGTVEVRFTAMGYRGIARFWANPFVRTLVFIFVVGYVAYWLYMKKTLRHLDPSAVIPERVKSALDVLTEGVALLDQEDCIVLANTTFSAKMGRSLSELLGCPLSDLTWTDPRTGGPPAVLPWIRARESGKAQERALLCLPSPRHGIRTFSVNSSPILDEDGHPRGTLATFDDITEFEQKNAQLEQLLDDLQASQREVERQNERLQILATRDPLTNCFNRRTFFERLEKEFAESAEAGKPLSCIMADIDKFKSVNDNYGHVVGDQVIHQVAGILQSGVRTIDVVGRYGGEEFCILLPGSGSKAAVEMASALRRSVETLPKEVLGLPPSAPQVTSSFGVASNADGAESALELVEQADRALYVSKTTGRNRVSTWHDVTSEQAA